MTETNPPSGASPNIPIPSHSTPDVLFDPQSSSAKALVAEIAEAFNSYTSEDLKEFRMALKVRSGGNHKIDIARDLAHHIACDAKGVLAVFSEDQRAWIAEMAHFDDADGRRFIVRHGRPMPKIDYPSGHRQGDRGAALLGLFIRKTPEGLTMPAPLRALLRAAIPKPASPPIPSTEEFPEVHEYATYKGAKTRKVLQHASETTALLEAREMLRLALLKKIKVAPKSRRPTSATVKEIGKSLVGGDFQIEEEELASQGCYEPGGAVRAHAWPVLLQQMGWARVKGEALVPHGPGKDFVETADPTLWPAAVSAYINDDKFDELNRIDNIRGQSGKGGRDLTLPSERKERIALMLAELPLGQWVTLKDFHRLMILNDLDFDVTTDRGAWNLYFCEQQYGALGYVYEEGIDGRLYLNRQYLRAALLESFATLGIVDVAYVAPHSLMPEFRGWWGADGLSFCGRYDGLLAIRLNPLGAYALEVAPSYHAQAALKTSVQVLPNLEILVDSEHTPPEDRVVLERFAEPLNERLWRLDRDRLLRSIREGMAPGEVLDYLAARSTREIPETVRHALDSWTARSRAIRSVSDAVLIEFHDTVEAMLLAHDSSARKLCLPAGPNAVVVPRKNLRALETVALGLGFVLPISNM